MWKEWKSFGRGKCLLGLVGERLTQTILASTRRRYVFVESNFCSEDLFLYKLTICRTEDVYIHASPPPSRWRKITCHYSLKPPSSTCSFYFSSFSSFPLC